MIEEAHGRHGIALLLFAGHLGGSFKHAKPGRSNRWARPVRRKKKLNWLGERRRGWARSLPEQLKWRWIHCCEESFRQQRDSRSSLRHFPAMPERVRTPPASSVLPFVLPAFVLPGERSLFQSAT